MSATITCDEATNSDIYKDPNLYSHEYSKLEDKSWQTWTDFEKDLEEFELKMSTAYRI